ncbi:hypothetical protein [Dolosigranulum savutiense]|uniref:Uncharacterized protein n=1 Tax=Dolosigranulum savutiense TaxID=3110288 RepID=A0AB74TYA6_9LACT
MSIKVEENKDEEYVKKADKVHSEESSYFLNQLLKFSTSRTN